MATPPPPTVEGIEAQLASLGVRRGQCPVVHASFRALRPVDGGPLGVLAALRLALGVSGTLVLPAMTGSRNPAAYDPAATPTKDMGALAEAFWRQPGVLRSGHPTSSFAAEGPHARAITGPQPLSPVYGPDSPIGRVWTADGFVLLLGVDHTANTTIHLAEALAEVPYRACQWATLRDGGQTRRVEFDETDHRCRNFALADGWLPADGLQREGMVGHAWARLARAHDVVDVVVDRLRADATRFLCPRGTGCEECEQAWLSVTA